MPSIRDAINNNINRIRAGGNTGTGQGLSPASVAPTPPLDIPNGLPQRGMFPANLVLSSDRSDSSRAFRGVGVRSSTFPYPPPKVTIATTKIISPATSGSGTPASSLKLQVNNIDNPDQNLLNLLSGENITLVQQPNGGVVITGSGGDGLVHGDSTDWWNDAGFSFWRDDFALGTVLATDNTGNSTNGELRWDGVLGSGASSSKIDGGFLNPGVMNVLSGTTLNTYSALYWPFAGADASIGTLPLFDYGGWKIVFVFGFPTDRQPSITSPFPLAKKQFYCGLTSGASNTVFSPANGVCARPHYFLGVRFDTDPGVTFTLSSVAASSGSTAVYTGTITGGGSDAFAGNEITVAGFSNSVNNGTFLCVASSTTTLTLLNSSAVLETHAATASTQALSDSTFKFEFINNYNFATSTRINTIGTVVDTGITPTEGAFYRLEILSTVAGQISIALSGGIEGSGSNASTTFSPSQTTVIDTTGRLTFSRNNGLGQVNQGSVASSPFVGLGTSNICYCSGSKVTISNAPQTFYDGTWTMSMNGTTRGTFPLAGASDTSSSHGTLTFFPGMAPYFAFGNDTQSSPATVTIGLDFFSMVFNGGIANESVVDNNARYF